MIYTGVIADKKVDKMTNFDEMKNLFLLLLMGKNWVSENTESPLNIAVHDAMTVAANCP